MAKGVKVRLDKKRHLLCTTETLANFERVTGKQLMAQSTFTNLTLRDMIALTWALLLHEDRRLTVDQVREMFLSLRSVAELHNGIQQAIADFCKELDR